MATGDGSKGVPKCYAFKSRLQEYAKKGKITSPTYETIMEGPPHKPSFRSTATVNGVRYDSLPGFSSRKSAEQSAAEVALIALANSGAIQTLQPVDETGFCINLLQLYSQRKSYSAPLYEFQEDKRRGPLGLHTCSVTIGGMKYIGAASKSKKEAKIKAAKTAFFVIQSDPSTACVDLSASAMCTVVPPPKRETPAALKPKKHCFKKEQGKKRDTNMQGQKGDLTALDGEVSNVSEVSQVASAGDSSTTLADGEP